MAAISIRDLTRKFGDLVAVDRISFEVGHGDLFGLLGPNGAGKTTIINMLTTLLQPTAGDATVAGFDIQRQKDAVRKNIGVVFQEPALDTNLTGRENLDFHARMYGIPRRVRDERLAEVLDLVELDKKADILVENYSGGMKRRLEIARGLIHHPQVLFLDEPTLGLDAQTRRHIWEYIRKMNREEEVTIILTTHYMEEAEYLCKTVAIIDNGRIVALDTPARLTDTLGGDVISLRVDNMDGACRDVLRSIPWIKALSFEDHECRLTVDYGEEKIPELVLVAQNHGVKIHAIHLHKPSLEEVFIHFTGKSIRSQEVSIADQQRENITRRMRRR